jgi:MFS family permease
MSAVRPESSQDTASAARTAVAREGSRAVVGLALAGAAWLLWRLTGFEYGLDQGIYDAVADVMAAGGLPYRDAWDFKPPGIYLVYASARGLFGEGMAAVRMLEALALGSLALAFAVLSRRFTGRIAPGLLGAALAISGHVWLGFWHTAQPESFGAVLLAWALVLATHPAGEGERAVWRRRLAWSAAGALYALAALMKPPLGGGFVVSLAFVLRSERREAARAARAAAWAPPILAFAVGAALPLLALLAYLGLGGALPDLFEALFVFTPEYTKLNYRTGNLPVFAFRALEFLLFRFSPLNPLGLLLLFVLPPLASREREGAAHVLGVLALVLIGIALQGRFFAYHYGAAVPLLALLAGWGLYKLTLLGERFGVGVALLAAAILLLANANGLKGPNPGGFVERARRIDDGRAHNRETRRTAAWVAAHTQPDDAIYVWGFQPMLYGLADRRPASRFVYNAPQRAPWYRTRGRPALMAELEADPPAAILVERGDVHPGTAGTELDSLGTLGRFPRLERFLREGYAPAETVGAFTIHLRRSPRAAGGPPSDRE